MSQSLNMRRVAGALGAEISGVDLAQPLAGETVAAIRQALVQHQVIFFRDQDLTPAQQSAFGARFGPLNIHPYVTGMADHPEVMEIIKEPTDRVNFGGGWHSDMSFLEEPALGSILHAIEVPEVGGDACGYRDDAGTGVCRGFRGRLWWRGAWLAHAGRRPVDSRRDVPGGTGAATKGRSFR